MKILVLSDSHNKKIGLDFKSYDCVIHCGDYGQSNFENSIFYVRGNCDFRGIKERVERIFGKKVLITHGDLYQVKYGLDKIVYRALELQCDVCFFGHTHCADVFVESKILFLNPGAYKDGYYACIDENKISLYKDGACYKILEYKW